MDPCDPSKMNGMSGGSTQHQPPSALVELQNDEMNFLTLQQPLAMGYYLSTAPAGPLPHWFWSTSAHREGINPTCFKVSQL